MIRSGLVHFCSSFDHGRESDSNVAHFESNAAILLSCSLLAFSLVLELQCQIFSSCFSFVQQQILKPKPPTNESDSVSTHDNFRDPFKFAELASV